MRQPNYPGRNEDHDFATPSEEERAAMDAAASEWVINYNWPLVPGQRAYYKAKRRSDGTVVTGLTPAALLTAMGRREDNRES